VQRIYARSCGPNVAARQMTRPKVRDGRAIQQLTDVRRCSSVIHVSMFAQRRRKDTAKSGKTAIHSESERSGIEGTGKAPRVSTPTKNPAFSFSRL
jgi:hypothetical protein